MFAYPGENAQARLRVAWRQQTQQYNEPSKDNRQIKLSEKW